MRVSWNLLREKKVGLVDMNTLVLSNPHLSQASVKLGPVNLRAGKGLVMWFYPSCLKKEGMRPAEHLPEMISLFYRYGC